MRLVARIRAIYPDLLFWCGLEGVPLSKKIAIIFTQMGMRKGPPDLVFPPLRYYQELKAPGAEPRDDQLKVHAELRRWGYTVEVFDNVELAWAALENQIRLCDWRPPILPQNAPTLAQKSRLLSNLRGTSKLR